MLQTFVIIIIFLGLFIWWVRHFERSQIYYPGRIIEQTPTNINLNYEDVTFNAEDGVELNGWFIPHENAIATILFFHGNAGNIGDRLETMQLFHHLGTNVFIIDYRGYGKSKGSPSEIGTDRDAMAAYRFLESRKDVEMKKIILFGESLGGAIAVDLATKIKPMGLIMDSTFTSIDDISREVYPFLPIRWLIRTKYDSISKIKTIHCPVLVAHSQEDDLVKFHHGQRLFDAANEPKEFLLLHGKHGESIGMNGDSSLDTLKQFIQRCIQSKRSENGKD